MYPGYQTLSPPDVGESDDLSNKMGANNRFHLKQSVLPQYLARCPPLGLGSTKTVKIPFLPLLKTTQRSTKPLRRIFQIPQQMQR